MKHIKIAAFAGILLIILASLFSRGLATKAATATSCTWQPVSSPNVSGMQNNYLNGIAATSTNDVWAVGYASNTVSSAGQTLIEHWDGSQWSMANSPNTGSSSALIGVAHVPGTNEAWAVGFQGDQTLTEHWDGSQWSIVSSPSVPPYASSLNAVVAISGSDLWAVGAYFTVHHGYRTLFEHWNGSQWSIAPSGNLGILSGVAAFASNDIWAVGYFFNNSAFAWQTLTEHWDGTQWSIVASPNMGSYYSYLYAVERIDGTNEMWAVGYFNTVLKFQTLVERWDGTQWSIVASPNLGTGDNSLNGIAILSQNDMWAVGNEGTGDKKTAHTLIEHWDGSQWSVVSLPVTQEMNLDAITRVPNNKQFWTAGEYDAESNGTLTAIQTLC